MYMEELQENEKLLYDSFTEQLGENNKFADFLTKVFKKKIKRVKKTAEMEGGMIDPPILITLLSQIVNTIDPKSSHRILRTLPLVAGSASCILSDANFLTSVFSQTLTKATVMMTLTPAPKRRMMTRTE